MPIICSARIARCSIVGEALFRLRPANFCANLSLNVLGPLLICINKIMVSDSSSGGKWPNKFSAKNVRIYRIFMQRRKFPI